MNPVSRWCNLLRRAGGKRVSQGGRCLWSRTLVAEICLLGGRRCWVCRWGGARPAGEEKKASWTGVRVGCASVSYLAGGEHGRASMDRGPPPLRRPGRVIGQPRLWQPNGGEV